MMAKNENFDEAPESEELLRKPNTAHLIEDQENRVFIIPTQSLSKEKPKSFGESEEAQEDLVSSVIGNYGRWQLLNTFLLSLFSFPCTFHIYIPTFLAPETNFWCRPPENLSSLPVETWVKYSQPVDACSVRVVPAGVTVESILNHTAPLLESFQKCIAWDFDRSEFGNTIISEWDLVCDRASYTSLSEVVFLIGVGIGGVTGGWVSDKFGRKPVLIIMITMQSALAILALLVRSFVQYVIVRLIMGLVSVSVVNAAFVLSVELVGGSWVAVAGAGIFFPLPFSYIIVSLLSLVLPNWWDLQLAISLPGCLLIGLWFLLPESPRWLISMGKIKEAKAILEKAAKFNKREFPADIDKLLVISNAEVTVEEQSVTLLFKGYLRKRTICLFIDWFAMTIGYYGLLLNIGKMRLGNLHVSSIILAAVEIPAIGLGLLILLKMGRRIPIFATMLVCGMSCLATELLSLISNNDWIMIACLMVGKFAISATNIMLPLYSAELYPTVIRNLGVGGSQVSAGLALICVPYLWSLETLNKHLPMVTIAVLGMIGAAIVLLLPETMPSKEPPTKEDKISAYCSPPCNQTVSAVDERVPSSG